MSKITLVRNQLTMLLAKWRIRFGFCPSCNSSAPAIDTCDVCDQYRTPYLPSWQTTERWMAKYKALRAAKLKGE